MLEKFCTCFALYKLFYNGFLKVKNAVSAYICFAVKILFNAVCFVVECSFYFLKLCCRMCFLEKRKRNIFVV
jgi:hypothetical protein